MLRHKACTKCQSAKAPSEFYAKRSWCKRCINADASRRMRELAKRSHIETPERKTCSTCALVKPSSGFSPHRGKPDGLQANCKECRVRQEKRRRNKLGARFSIPNPSEKKCTSCKLTLLGSDFAKDPLTTSGLMGACRACRLKRSNAYCRTNGNAKHKLRTKRYKKSASGRLAENLSRQRRRARLLDGNSPGVSRVDWLATLEYFNHQCAYCLGPAETIDHIEAVATGGRDESANVVPACNVCNASKCDKSLLDCLLDPERIVTRRMLSAA